jgi:Co/Zn/Cd efflux system component
MPGGHTGEEVLERLANELHKHLGIEHVTVQVEADQHVDCALESDQFA